MSIVICLEQQGELCGCKINAGIFECWRLERYYPIYSYGLNFNTNTARLPKRKNNVFKKIIAPKKVTGNNDLKYLHICSVDDVGGRSTGLEICACSIVFH